MTEETTDSFRVSWQAAPGSVIRYHLTYVPRSGVGELLQTMTSGPETTIVLQELLPITTYQVSVSAEYSAGTGQANQVDGTTKEGAAPQHALKISLHSFFYNVLVDKSICFCFCVIFIVEFMVTAYNLADIQPSPTVFDES